MKKFLMDTSSVTNTANDVKSLVSSADKIYETINSWQIDCSDFEFNVAKGAILTNVKGMSKKISNTSDLILECVDAHDKLQTEVTKGSDEVADVSNGNDQGSQQGYDNLGGGFGSGPYRRSEEIKLDEVTKLADIKGLSIIIPIKDKKVLDEQKYKDMVTELLKKAKKLGVEVKYVLEENLTEEEKKKAYVVGTSSDLVKSISSELSNLSKRLNTYVTLDGATSKVNSNEVSTGVEVSTEASTSLDITKDKKELAGALIVKNGEIIDAIAKDDDTKKFQEKIIKIIEKEK